MESLELIWVCEVSPEPGSQPAFRTPRVIMKFWLFLILDLISVTFKWSFIYGLAYKIYRTTDLNIFLSYNEWTQYKSRSQKFVDLVVLLFFLVYTSQGRKTMISSSLQGTQVPNRDLAQTWQWVSDCVFVTNSIFPIPITLNPDGVNLWYFTISFFDLTKFKVLNI